MMDANGQPAPAPIVPPLRTYTAWGKDGVVCLFRKGTDPPFRGHDPTLGIDTDIEPIFTVEARDWDEAQALYFRRLAVRVTGRPL